MPYKNKKKQAKAQQASYLRNRATCIARTRKRQNDWAAWLLTIKANLCCSKCPETYPRCLDFHHLDKEAKSHSISRMVRDCRPHDEILAEIRKCIVLCANCHRKLELPISTSGR